MRHMLEWKLHNSRFREISLWDPWLPSAEAPPAPCFQSTFYADPQSHTEDNKGERLLCQFVCKSWLLLEYQTSPQCHAVLGRKGSLVVRLIFMPGFSYLENIPWLFFWFCVISGCGSASLKLCVRNAASSWSQSSSQDSQSWEELLTVREILTVISVKLSTNIKKNVVYKLYLNLYNIFWYTF